MFNSMNHKLLTVSAFFLFYFFLPEYNIEDFTDEVAYLQVFAVMKHECSMY